MKRSDYSNPKVTAAKGVRTLERSIQEVERALERDAAVGVVYLDFFGSCPREDRYCGEAIDRLLLNTVQALRAYQEKNLPYLDIFPASPVRGDDLIVFFVPKGSARLQWTEALLSKMAGMVREQFSSHARDILGVGSDGALEFFLGWSSITPAKGISKERLIYRAIRKATDITAEQRYSEVSKLALELERVIDRGQITTVFQPIVHLKEKAVFGYEALARGPDGNRFNDSEVIFSIASRGGFLMKTERLAKISAIESARSIPDQYKLFLNIEAELLVKPEELMIMLREVGCRPGRIVFEITERKAVKDFERLQKIVKLMKDEGYQFAIDDAGSGYASMESIAILDPHYIKLDQSMVRGVETSFVKQDVVRAFVNLSKMRHATLIAEGVEQEGEYRTLNSLGVEYAQGFFFARPSFPPPTMEALSDKR